MPGSIPPADLALMRSGHLYVRRYLSVVPRTSVYTAVVSSVLRDEDTNGIYQINFTSGSGTLSDVLEGYTIDVGTTAGARNVGVLRVRKAPTSGVFFVAETAPGSVDVRVGHHLTARVERRPWWRYPRGVATRDSSNFINTIVEYSDYDVAYTNQNHFIQPQANIYADSSKNQVCLAGWVDPTTSVRTVTLYGEIVVMAQGAAPAGSPYLWNVADGTITVGTATSQSITVTFPSTTVFRYISLTVTDSNNATHTRYMPIWSHSASNPPISAFSVGRDERRAEHGREMTVEFFGSDNTLTNSVIPEGTGFCYWEDARFGASGAEAPPSYIDCFYGWALNDEKPLILNNRSTYLVTIGGIASWLDRYTAFPATLRNTGKTATVWHEMRYATVRRAIHYALRRYSNALDIGNFEPGSVGAVAEAIELNSGSIWTQIKDLATAAYMSEVGADSTNNIRVRRKYSYTNVYDSNDSATLLVGERTPIPIVVALNKNDWQDDEPPSIDETKHDTVGVVNAGGGFWIESEEHSTILRAVAPGKTPGVGVSKVDLPGQYLDPVHAQERLNSLANHHFYHENNPYKNINLKLIHNLDVIEPCDNEPVTITWADPTITNLQVNAVRYIVRSVTVIHSDEMPQREVIWELERETIAPRAGEKVDVPETPITISPPNPPPYQPPPYNPGALGQGTGKIAIFCTDNTLRRTTNFNSTSPTWTTVNLTTLTGWGGGTIQDFTVDAFSPLYRGTGTSVNGWILTTTHVQRITNIFGTPTLGTATALAGSPPHRQMQFERGVQNWGMIAWMQHAVGVRVVYTTDGVNWNTPTLPSVFDNYDLNPTHAPRPGLWLNPHLAGHAVVTVFTNTAVHTSCTTAAYETFNYGATWSLKSSPTINPNNWTAGTIIVPYQDTAAANFFYGRNNALPSPPHPYRLYRNGTDISPVVSATPYGSSPQEEPIWRRMAICDVERNTLVLVGKPETNSAINGVFRTRNALAASPTWTTIIAPSNTVQYRGVYIAGDNPDTYYLFGVNLNIAQVVNGNIIRDKRGNMTGSATIVGLCGG